VRTRRPTHRRRIIAAVVAAVVVPVVAAPAAALADAADVQYPRPVPATTTSTPSDFAPKIGDTPAEFARPVASAPKAGDTKFDSPGASRAPQYDPTHTIQIVRPQRTIVRETDQLLPIALSSVALLVALGLAGTALIRVRALRLGS
jgi:hypothetical protein